MRRVRPYGLHSGASERPAVPGWVVGCCERGWPPGQIPRSAAPVEDYSSSTNLLGLRGSRLAEGQASRQGDSGLRNSTYPGPVSLSLPFGAATRFAEGSTQSLT